MQSLKNFYLDSIPLHMYHKGIAYFRTHSISGSFIQIIYLYILKARYYRINFFYYFYKETSHFGVWIFIDVNISATRYINVIHSKIMLKWYILVSCMVDNSIYMYSDKGLNFNGLWISMKSNKIWAQFIINSINFIYLVLCETQCSSSCHWTLFIMSLNHHVVRRPLVFLLQLWCHDCMLKLCFLQLLYQILFKMFCDMKDSGNIIKFKMKFGVESRFIL